MANILVTGCTGFIGSHLSRRLIADGHKVHGLVRHTCQRDYAVFGTAVNSMEFVEGDITDYHSIQSAVDSCSPEVVVHLAALTPVRLSFDDPFPYANVNFLGTANLVHVLLERVPNARLVAATTAEVYGWQGDEPIDEDARFFPSSPYGVSKAAADNYVQMAIRVYGLRATVLRCNNTYGRVGDANFLTEYVINSMIRGETVYIGAPTHVRDYMYIEDHVNAFILAIREEKSIGKTYNVSPGNPMSNLEIANKLANLIGYKGKLVQNIYPPGYPRRSGELDTLYIVLDASKIRSELGWKPTVSLEQGLLRTIEAWRKTVH